MVEKTLLAMKKGGIYDQVGGGLCRYSTDSMWLVPHFEKMLYDNALFISILAETYRLEKREIFKQAALDVINYVERDLVLDEGGIASAEDADSEGEEGKFYLWDLSHFQEILGTDAEFFSAYWHLSEEGNFEGKNILNENFRIYPLPEEEDSSLSARKEKVRKSLLEERNKRIRPQRDDKVLTSWNCLYIRALIESGMSFSDESLIQKAKNHYEFINTHLFNSEGRLLRRYREGESAIPAYLVDYAELAYVSILLYKISFNIDYMKRAVFLTDESIRLFYSGFGPFFETGSDAEVLIRRSIQSYDGVEPSGNSTMAMVLLELCRYGHKKYYGYLKSLFSYFKEDLEKYGMSHAFLLKVYLLYTGGPSREIIIIGEKENEELQKILNVYYTHFVPGLSFAVSTKDELSINSELIPLLKGRETEKDF
ncbi:MAG: thioredoxin domain-containing protein, partial [Leptospiraceae bacterium]|nr:thioredoxin domain-containing protein [Leptospiraceae bacterium]